MLLRMVWRCRCIPWPLTWVDSMGHTYVVCMPNTVVLQLHAALPQVDVIPHALPPVHNTTEVLVQACVVTLSDTSPLPLPTPSPRDWSTLGKLSDPKLAHVTRLFVPLQGKRSLFVILLRMVVDGKATPHTCCRGAMAVTPGGLEPPAPVIACLLSVNAHAEAWALRNAQARSWLLEGGPRMGLAVELKRTALLGWPGLSGIPCNMVDHLLRPRLPPYSVELPPLPQQKEQALCTPVQMKLAPLRHTPNLTSDEAAIESIRHSVVAAKAGLAMAEAREAQAAGRVRELAAWTGGPISVPTTLPPGFAPIRLTSVGQEDQGRRAIDYPRAPAFVQDVGTPAADILSGAVAEKLGQMGEFAQGFPPAPGPGVALAANPAAVIGMAALPASCLAMLESTLAAHLPPLPPSEEGMDPDLQDARRRARLLSWAGGEVSVGRSEIEEVCGRPECLHALGLRWGGTGGIPVHEFAKWATAPHGFAPADGWNLRAKRPRKRDTLAGLLAEWQAWERNTQHWAECTGQYQYASLNAMRSTWQGARMAAAVYGPRADTAVFCMVQRGAAPTVTARLDSRTPCMFHAHFTVRGPRLLEGGGGVESVVLHNPAGSDPDAPVDVFAEDDVDPSYHQEAIESWQSQAQVKASLAEAEHAVASDRAKSQLERAAADVGKAKIRLKTEQSRLAEKRLRLQIAGAASGVDTDEGSQSDAEDRARQGDRQESYGDAEEEDEAGASEEYDQVGCRVPSTREQAAAAKVGKVGGAKRRRGQ